MHGFGISLGFTTYGSGKLVRVGPGNGNEAVVSECSFGSAMTMTATDNGLTVDTLFQIWYLENGLPVIRRGDYP